MPKATSSRRVKTRTLTTFVAARPPHTPVSDDAIDPALLLLARDAPMIQRPTGVHWEGPAEDAARLESVVGLFMSVAPFIDEGVDGYEHDVGVSTPAVPTDPLRSSNLANVGPSNLASRKKMQTVTPPEEHIHEIDTHLPTKNRFAICNWTPHPGATCKYETSDESEMRKHILEHVKELYTEGNPTALCAVDGCAEALRGQQYSRNPLVRHIMQHYYWFAEDPAKRCRKCNDELSRPDAARRHERGCKGPKKQ